MLLLVVMSVLVALSDLFGPGAEVMKLELNGEKKVPIYVAVLYAFIFPLCAGTMNIVVKYSSMTLKLEASDWVQANSLLYGLIGTLVGLGHFLTERGSF